MAESKPITKRLPRKQTQEVQVQAILADFFKKSSSILENARKEARMKHPELFKAS